MKKLLLALSLLIGISANAATSTVKTFAPPNDLYIAEPLSPMANNIVKETFKKAMDDFEAYAKPVLEEKGWKLELRRLWTDGTVNAQTWHDGKTVVIEMFGGLARYTGMTGEGMRLVACHELGHTLAGSPLYTGSDMSVEGQSDYYATSICAKAIGISKRGDQALANVLASLGGEGVPSIKTPDSTVVDSTLESHPNAQCRLDTYTAGRVGNDRPRCWYAPPPVVVN